MTVSKFGYRGIDVLVTELCEDVTTSIGELFVYEFAVLHRARMY